MPPQVTQPDAHKAKALAHALTAWLEDLGGRGESIGAWHQIGRDAINQATKAETIEWLAAIAERYGFKPPEDVTNE